MKAGVDTLYGVTPEPKLTQGILEAEQRTGRKCITIAIPTLPLETTPAGMGNDVATYIQIYNAAGFLMQVEIDWVQRIIWEAQKPVITIKPLAAGKLPPLVGLAFSWSTIRDRDMVCIGTSTAFPAWNCRRPEARNPPRGAAPDRMVYREATTDGARRISCALRECASVLFSYGTAAW